jgi:hypothetical protein
MCRWEKGLQRHHAPTSPGSVEQLAGAMLLSIWTDLAPADNEVTLDLAAR